ncbi:MAG: Gfo/Idh/MocA family oxidoreductase, partial [Terriglobales bacterium]
MIKFGVIGYGYWGPNVVRNLRALEDCQVVAICDQSPVARKRIQAAHPGIQVHSDFHELVKSPEVDAIAVITPVWTHYELAKTALENGKHVFVEKPFTSNVAQAEELINLAEQKHLQIMVDHTFLFTGAVRKIQKLLKEDTLGKLYYYDSTRVNLGLFQHDCNVIWDLAPHDLSIMNHLLHKDAEAISATGQAHLNGHADIAFITAYFPDKMIAHINVNWISPVKVRTTLIGGEKKMLVWNDLEADEKLKIYDKGVDVTSQEG